MLDQKSKEIENKVTIWAQWVHRLIKPVIWSAHTQFISLSNWP